MKRKAEEYFFYFMLYSVIGWIYEVFLEVVVYRWGFSNRGALFGPYCIIYGVGALILIFSLSGLKKQRITVGKLNITPLLVFLGIVVITTVVELIGSYIMEAATGEWMWDYRRFAFNFQGRICLGASLGWGVFTVALFYVLHPFVEWIVSLYSAAAGKILVCAAGALYIADFCISFANAMQIGKRLRSMDEVMDSIYEFVQSSKLYESVEELRGRLASYPLSEYGAELRKRLEARVDAVIAFTSELTPEEQGSRREAWRAQIEEYLGAAQSRYEQLKSHRNIFIRRAMNAYPNMKSRAQALKERAARRLDKRDED